MAASERSDVRRPALRAWAIVLAVGALAGPSAWSCARRPASKTRWSIGIWEGPSPFAVRPAPGRPDPVLTARDVTDLGAEFVADPFLWRQGDRWHLFFEVLEEKTQRGRIGLATSDDTRHWRYDRIVLREPFHLSYPYVFSDGNEIYMVPETYEAGSVRLYRAARFPYDWQLQKVLLTGRAFVDSSLFQFRGRWWMLTSTPENDRLFLYFSDALEGPWREHPMSPVVRGNPHIARPGGRVLVIGDRVYRFGQDDAPKYGTRLFAFEIVELTPDTYREVPVGDGPVVGPSGSGWNSDRMHTLDAHALSPEKWIASVDGKGLPYP